MSALILQGDARRVPLGDKSVDMVLASPFYTDARTYGRNDISLGCKDWINFMLKVTHEALRVSRGPVFWVCWSPIRNHRYWPAPEGLLYRAFEEGLHAFRPCLWIKNGIPGSGGRQWLRSAWEYVLCFKPPGPLPWSDNLAMGTPPKYPAGGNIRNRSRSGTRCNRMSPLPRLTNPGDVLDIPAESIPVPSLVDDGDGVILRAVVGGGLLGQSQVSGHLSFAFQPTDRIFANTLNLFLVESYSAFMALQSRVHENWARFFGSSMKDDLRYTTSDCFETFPFPANFDADPYLESVGQAYYDFRAALMMKHNEGLTKTYNRFHDRDHDATEPNKEVVAGIVKLRELHAAMDRAVLDAYGWTDIPTDCQFLLDYEEEEDETDTPSSGRGRKKPWRYRWPDEVRDEVLARLLEENKKRAEAERLAGVKAAEAKPPSGKGRKKKSKAEKWELTAESAGQPLLPGMVPETSAGDVETG